MVGVTDVRPGTAPDATPAGPGTARPGATVSVVVPAHDEERVLVTTLAALRTAALREVPDVVVVANGCTDGTAAAARAAGARVVELGTASKVAALRAGDDAAGGLFPRVYLDADISLGAGALDGLAAALRRDGVHAASPRVVFDTSASSWAVRRFYDAYRELPYVRDGLVGLGVYGLSATGRGRFGPFPDVTSDDLFVQRVVAPGERATSDGEFTVAAPRTLGNLLKVRTRTAAGNAQLSAVPGAGAPGAGAAAPEADLGRTTGGTTRALLRLAMARPGLLPSVAVYTAVTVASRVAARRRQPAWQRDTSTR